MGTDLRPGLPFRVPVLYNEDADYVLPSIDLTVGVARHLRRSAWGRFPDVIIHNELSRVKRHPSYYGAKEGDARAADGLVLDTMAPVAVDTIKMMVGATRPHLLAVHAIETEGMNAIPRVLALALSRALDLPMASGVVQINRVAHTGADGYRRLAFPALFGGDVAPKEYFLVDDFIGQGGTLANLKGFVESRGGAVIGATVLTGKAYSAGLTLREGTLNELRNKHGEKLEEWWIAAFGYGFERLTESEARYLIRGDNAHVIAERIIAARRARD
jgi:hypothetical protein